MKYQLPQLPYAYGAMEPYIDAPTMEIHHTKHHQGYVDKLNAALSKLPEWQDKKLEELLTGAQWIPKSYQQAVRNNGGGHYNHSFFWQTMKPNGGGKPGGMLLRQIQADFGSFQNFQRQFSEAALAIFGSGWAWLVAVPGGALQIVTTPNQDNPLMTNSGKPIMGVDVWEHAYYLQYQNRRVEYIKNWWAVVNWDKIAERYQSQMVHEGL